jgi:hypothetical protein
MFVNNSVTINIQEGYVYAYKMRTHKQHRKMVRKGLKKPNLKKKPLKIVDDRPVREKSQPIRFQHF